MNNNNKIVEDEESSSSNNEVRPAEPPTHGYLHFGVGKIQPQEITMNPSTQSDTRVTLTQ